MQRSITPPVGPISARPCCRETPPPWPAAERSVFASIAAIDIYVDRMRLADLFLDSYPYNAAATCNDALWAGFPFSPMLGRPMSAGGREACWEPPSFRHSFTDTLVVDEALALRLATGPGLLALFKQRLAHGRDASIDMPEFTMLRSRAPSHARTMDAEPQPRGLFLSALRSKLR